MPLLIALVAGCIIAEKRCFSSGSIIYAELPPTYYQCLFEKLITKLTRQIPPDIALASHNLMIAVNIYSVTGNVRYLLLQLLKRTSAFRPPSLNCIPSHTLRLLQLYHSAAFRR